MGRLKGRVWTFGACWVRKGMEVAIECISTLVSCLYLIINLAVVYEYEYSFSPDAVADPVIVF